MIGGQEVREIIPFPILKFHFLYSKQILDLLNQKLEKYCKRRFLIGAQEVGEFIPFPVWIIPFPVCTGHFGLLSKTDKHFVKEVFKSEVCKLEQLDRLIIGTPR